MSEQYADTIPESFVQFIEQRQSTNRETAVYVEGDLDNDPPLGNAAARHVASILAGEDKEVLRVGPESAADDEVPDNVGAVQITLPKDPSEAEWKPVQRRLLSRVPCGVDIVVLVDTDAVPWFCKHLADARMVATKIDEPIESYRVRLEPMSGDIYYHEFEEVGIDA